jgi:RHH-type transcriptional regulator, proline utilization regulon repressor / proline dehydrogenase / delta 1-pyrroline-5-carboxylate dehydrogenase
MRARGFKVAQAPLPPEAANGTFVAPTLIEINRIADVEREIFGPVLHVLRFKRAELDRLIGDINAAGYGLTFGLHTRIDETIARVVDRIEAGNIYVNRNIIGATVGVQPFGGAGLSGTGPKAGGPLYLCRLVEAPPPHALDGLEGAPAARDALRAFADWLRAKGEAAAAERCVGLGSRSPLGARVEFSGPVGERNVYDLQRRGLIAAAAESAAGLYLQIAAIVATGNDAAAPARLVDTALRGLPPELTRRISRVDDPLSTPGLRGALVEGEGEAVSEAARRLAARQGPIVRMQALSSERLAGGEDYALADLVEERAISTNIAAAGGNASLMSIG